MGRSHRIRLDSDESIPPASASTADRVRGAKHWWDGVDSWAKERPATLAIGGVVASVVLGGGWFGFISSGEDSGSPSGGASQTTPAVSADNRGRPKQRLTTAPPATTADAGTKAPSTPRKGANISGHWRGDVTLTEDDNGGSVTFDLKFLGREGGRESSFVLYKNDPLGTSRACSGFLAPVSVSGSDYVWEFDIDRGEAECPYEDGLKFNLRVLRSNKLEVSGIEDDFGSYGGSLRRR